jgi:type II secretory pathway pseudopilin PulG
VSSKLRDRANSEAGWTLVELLVAMMLMLIVLSATLVSFNSFYDRSAVASTQNDALEQARRSSELLARQLRNLASPKPEAGVASSFFAVDYWSPYDIVFKTAEPSRRRVRYCLDSSDPANGKIWQQVQTVPSAGASDPGITGAMVASCPVDPAANAWATKTVVSDHVVNRIAGKDRPVFAYDQTPSASLPVPPVSAADFTAWGAAGTTVREVRSVLWIDVTSAIKEPSEQPVQTRVFLRNQNQKPTASFTGTPGGNHQVLLNGSGSDDPEGRTLQMSWYLGSSYPGCPAGAGGTGYTLMGSGPTLTHGFPDSSDRTVTLEVADPGGLCDSLTKTVHPDAPTP